MNRLWRGYLAFGAVAVVPVFALSGNSGEEGSFPLVGLACVLAIAVGMRMHQPDARGPWRLLLIGQAIGAAGDLGYLAAELDRAPGLLVPVGDVLFIVASLAQSAGLLGLVRQRTPGRDRAGLIDASGAAIGVGVLLWVFLIEPEASHTSLPNQLAAFVYPALSLLGLAVVLRLLIDGGARGTAFWFITTACLLQFMANTIHSALGLYGGDGGDPIHVAWLAFPVLLGAAALHPSMGELSKRAVERADDRARRLRLVLLAVASLLAPAVLVALAATHSYESTGVVAVASAVGFLLVVARMADLLRQVEDQAARLGALARVDALTGVPNRRSWDDELARALTRARRAGAPVHVALLDLDHFKQFNDTNGHPAGDRLLKEAAAAWLDRLRATDLLARYGGEEFGVLLEGLDPREAVRAIERLRDGTPHGRTFSAGVATWNAAENAEELVNRADVALYAAKRAGRDRVMYMPDGALTPPAGARAQPDLPAAAKRSD
jgi:diguanylate cyclase (GGDEF)-like protein